MTPRRLVIALLLGLALTTGGGAATPTATASTAAYTPFDLLDFLVAVVVSRLGIACVLGYAILRAYDWWSD